MIAYSLVNYLGIVNTTNVLKNTFISQMNVYISQVVRKATGQCTETMARQTWDASEFVGQKAFLRLVDAYSNGWGHINFDDLRGDIIFVYCNIY